MLRSPKVKKGRKRSNVDLNWKYANCVSKLHSRPRLFKKLDLKDTKGHHGSKISEKVEKGQISIYIWSMQIIYQNDPLNLALSENLISRSRPRKKVKKWNFWSNTCMFSIPIKIKKFFILYFSWKNFIHCDDVCYQFGHYARNRIRYHVYGGQTKAPNN